MSRYETKDIKLTADGDFELDEFMDIVTVEKEELVHQMVMIPLKTVNPDWLIHDIGADLEDLLGMDNTRETAELGKTKIKESLLRTEFFEEEDIWIEAKPKNEQTIIFFVFIRSSFSEEALVYQVDMNLGFGAEVRKVY